MVWALVTPLVTQGASAAVVNNIAVSGNQRVEDSTIIEYMQISRGENVDADKIDDAVRLLFQTGLFSDVSIVPQGNTLSVRVVENPLINVVNFEGNSELKDDALAKEVEVRERMIFTKSRAQSDTRRILSLYQRSGFYNVRVAPKLIRLADNRVNLVFEINEGNETKVRSIRFSGNNNFGAGTLQGVIATKEYAWWRFFGRNNTYDPDRLEYDKELLRQHYLKNGFADVEIVSADAELADDGFIINFNVNEGPRYRISDVAINVGDANLNEGSLRKAVKTGVGDTFNATKVNRSAENLTLEAAEQGFVFAKVDPKVDKEPGNATLSLTYDITEGPRTYIERIEIVGNYRTLDEVIRREIRLFEGDALNKSLVERARRRLQALDFFEKIEITDREGSAPDKVVLVVEVAEKSTGSVSFAVGYSSVEKVVGSVELAERNLFGRGQDVRLNTSLSFKRQQLDFSFTEPYFMDMPISAGVDLFATRSDLQNVSSYDSEQIGGALRTGFKLDETSTLGFKYTLARRKITDINAATASPAILEQQGVNWKSAFAATYTYDDLDNPINPSSGFKGLLKGEIAGLGGDDRYASIEASAWYFQPILDEQVVVKLEGNVGHIRGLGNDKVPLQDRFFKGGASFRGFEDSGVGPKQIGNGGGQDAIGATTYAIGTVEAVFPLGLPESLGIEGVAFSDFGTVFGSENNSVAAGTGLCSNGAGINCTVLDSKKFRASIGAGVIWQSPFGPLRVEAAYPIIKARGDEKQWFNFSIGTRF